MRVLILASALLLTSIQAATVVDEKRPEPKNSPVGSWRKMESIPRQPPTTLTITDDKLIWIDMNERMEADYSVTRDSILFGIIIKISGESFRNGPVEDDTFSFRYRADEGELYIRGIKGVGSDSLSRIAGRYTKVDGSPGTRTKASDIYKK